MRVKVAPRETRDRTRGALNGSAPGLSSISRSSRLLFQRVSLFPFPSFPPSFVISLPLSLHPCPFPAMHREFILSLILSHLEKSNRQHDLDLRFDELLDKFSSYIRQLVRIISNTSDQVNSKWNKFSKQRYPSISLWYIFYFLLNTIWNYLKTVPSNLKNIYY